MLHMSWRSQEVMPALPKEKRGLIPDVALGLPFVVSEPWPLVDPDLGKSVSLLHWQCCSGFQCDHVSWPFWVSHHRFQCPKARTPALSQYAGQACALESDLDPGVPDSPLRTTQSPLRGGSSSLLGQNPLLLGHGLGA